MQSGKKGIQKAPCGTRPVRRWHAPIHDATFPGLIDSQRIACRISRSSTLGSAASPRATSHHFRRCFSLRLTKTRATSRASLCGVSRSPAAEIRPSRSKTWAAAVGMAGCVGMRINNRSCTRMQSMCRRPVDPKSGDVVHPSFHPSRGTRLRKRLAASLLVMRMALASHRILPPAR